MERSLADLIDEWDHYERAPQRVLPPWSDRAYEHETATTEKEN
jgi:hypothetical protein